MYSEEQIIRSMEYCIRQYEHPTEFSSCAYLMKSPDDDRSEYYCKYYGRGKCNDRYEMLKDAVKLLKTQKEKKLNSDPVLSAMEHIVSEYRDQGVFTVDGEEYSTSDMMNHLRNNTDIGHKFRTLINEMILTYLMKFKD